ncbi:MAG: type II toxin-antitoxin system RelE/ParE family toxin [Betaproteobacteria bacterium]|nr:type II toxin-antitoxin system RelE/ParE family toxin [Betaproteobacteria bacterium]
MPRLIWSPHALLDVQRLYRFLASRNIPAAKRAVSTLREGVKIISVHPEIGRPVEDMEPEYREWRIDFGDSGYVVLYRYDGKTAVILAVRHRKEFEYKGLY